MKKIILFFLTLAIILGLCKLVLFKPDKPIKGLSVPKHLNNTKFDIKSPSALVIYQDLLFTVTDSSISNIKAFKINSDGNISSQFSFGKQGNDPGEFGMPLGLAVESNYLYVADPGNGRIQVFKINNDGNVSLKSCFGKQGKNLGEFGILPSLVLPVGLAVKDSYLYVADSGNSRIQIFKIDNDGSITPKFVFGKQGKNLGEFGILSSPLLKVKTPLCLAVKDSYLYVADSGNSRIQVFKINNDASITPKYSFGKQGNNLGEFVMPFGLAIKGNYLFVIDSGNSRIQVLKINKDGSIVPKFIFGKQGKNLGELGGENNYFTMLVIKDNHLFVADTGNNRIQVLKIEY